MCDGGGVNQLHSSPVCAKQSFILSFSSKLFQRLWKIIIFSLIFSLLNQITFITDNSINKKKKIPSLSFIQLVILNTSFVLTTLSDNRHSMEI